MIINILTLFGILTADRTDSIIDTPLQQRSPIAAVFLLRNDGAALLQLRDNKPGLRNAGMWVPPGGGLEENESQIECAYREFFEETAYRCTELIWLASIEDVVEGWPEYQLTIFWGFYDDQQHFRCQEGQDLKFVMREEADQYQVPKKLISLWDLALEEANICLVN